MPGFGGRCSTVSFLRVLNGIEYEWQFRPEKHFFQRIG
jgi:hypothetical protein